MTLRPADPDELGRAQSLPDGHPVSAQAAFLVAVKEQPVERLLAAIPWWQVPGPGGQPASLRCFLNGSGIAWSDPLEPPSAISKRWPGSTRPPRCPPKARHGTS